MNPNSANQVWSLWEYRVYPDALHRPDYTLVKENAARFGRIVFGSASQMRLLYATDERGRLYWEVAILTEGHPVQDQRYVWWVHQQWVKFFQNGFGTACEVFSHARLEAGDRQDGAPPDQLIILPTVTFEGEI